MVKGDSLLLRNEAKCHKFSSCGTLYVFTRSYAVNARYLARSTCEQWVAAGMEPLIRLDEDRSLKACALCSK